MVPSTNTSSVMMFAAVPPWIAPMLTSAAEALRNMM
jgi:hypothetical protein